MADSVVGVAFGGSEIRGVELSVGWRGSCNVIGSGAVPVEATAFENGQIVDPASVSRALKELWATAGFKSKKVRLGVDGRLAVVRRTELPSLGAAGMRRAAGYDIAELLNYPLADAVYDVAKLDQFSREDVGWARALVVSVKEETLELLRQVVRDADLRPVATELVADSLVRSTRPIENGGTAATDGAEDGASAPTPDPDSEESSIDPEQPWVVIDVEDSATTVVVRDQGGTLFARTLSAGVGAGELSLADELESELASLTGGFNDSGGDAGPVAAGVTTVTEGVRRTLSYYRDELDDRPFATILVTGGRSSAPGLRRSLADAVHLPVEAAASTIPWPIEVDDWPGYEVALGVALSGAKPLAADRRLLLVSDRVKEQTARRKHTAVGLAVAAFVGMVLTVDGLSRRSEADDLLADAAQAESYVDLLADELFEFDDLRYEHDDVDDFDQRTQELVDQRMRYLDVVQEVAELMPPESHLVNIRLQRSNGEDYPVGYTGANPPALISITGVTQDLGGVGHWIEDVTAAGAVDGLWLAQSSYGPIGAGEELGALFTLDGVITESARSLPESEMVDTP